MEKIYLLGAGVSADFSPNTYSRGYPINKGSFKSFPTTNNFIHRAIELERLRSNYPLVEFIEKNYNINFTSLKAGAPLDIEKLYQHIYELSESVDMMENPEEAGRSFTLLWSIEELIREIPQHYSTVYGICENYSIFAKYIVESHSSVISFNWDTFFDEALFNTGRWFYNSGYGFEFLKIYLDRQEIEKGNNTSSILLLKPHGSINWFRYMEHYSSTKDGFTGEYVSDEERMQTFLMLFSRNKRGILIHPRNMRLDMAKNWKLNLKMPCALDIIYPAKKSKVNKINYFRIYEEMQNCFKNGDEIISIGFALKKSEQEELKGLEIKKSAKITIVNEDNSIDIASRYKDVFKTSNVTFSKEKTFREYCESLKNTEIKYECGNLYKS